MNRSARIAVAVLAVSSLAACAGAPTIPHNYVSQGYRVQDLSYTAGRGGMLTQIVGNPFDAPKGQVDTVVTEVLEIHHFGPQMPFFTEPPEGFKSPYKVVVVLNPGIATSAAKLCANPDQPRSAEPGRVKVVAAFCLEDYRITSAGGSVDGASDPNGPAFRKLMQQVALLLFPSRVGDPGANDAPGRNAN